MLFRLGAKVVHIDIAARVAATTTTSIPAICADAGLVPWAERGDQADLAMTFAP